MSVLTINMLIEAFSKLTPEERARPLLLDTSAFFNALERTPNQVSLFGLNETSFVLSPTTRISPKEERTTLLSFHVKSPDNPDYAILGITKSSVIGSWFENCQKAGLKLRNEALYNEYSEED